MSNEYHGQNLADGREPQDVPPEPANLHVDTPANATLALGTVETFGGPRGPVVQGGAGLFARVRFKGQYGLLCAQYQEFERQGISQKEARTLAWAAFGLCGHTITYLDARGNLLFEES